VTTQDALTALATSTAAAAVETLRLHAPGEVAEGEIAVTLQGRDPLEDVTTPAVLSSVSYAGGVQGGNLFVMPLEAARRLAATMATSAETEIEAGEGADELTELELSALGEAMNQMMAAAAATTGEVLEEAVEIEIPEVREVRSKADLKANFQGATRATVAVITLFGEPCRLIQLVPTVFTMRMTQALASGPTATENAAATAALRHGLRNVPLRVWAELGRAQLRTMEVAGLGDGSIVDLDHAADDPVDVYVNGSRIGTGRLICTEDADWAVRLEEVFSVAEAGEPAEGGL
jgi:flagellar motor switch protein FliN